MAERIVLHCDMNGFYASVECLYHPEPVSYTHLVARHDDDGIAEVHGTALSVGEAAVFEDLQQHVEHVGMRLFDLVQQHHAVRAAAHLLGQLPAL